MKTLVAFIIGVIFVPELGAVAGIICRLPRQHQATNRLGRQELQSAGSSVRAERFRRLPVRSLRGNPRRHSLLGNGASHGQLKDD